jgi:hypothetical protein
MSEKENNPLNEDQNNFDLPKNYFQKSANSIFNKVEWEEEHKDFPKLKENKKNSGFIIPENYFASNEMELELTDFPAILSVPKKDAFKVPDDFFEIAESKIYERLDVRSSLSMLEEIQKQNNFKVEEGYFSENEKRLYTLLETSKPVRIINLVVKRSVYAVAALLVVVIGIWMYDYYFTPVTVKDCGTIACVDRNDLVKSKSLESLDEDELYEVVNSKELEKKLEQEELNTQPKNEKDSSQDDSSEEDLLDEI